MRTLRCALPAALLAATLSACASSRTPAASSASTPMQSTPMQSASSMPTMSMSMPSGTGLASSSDGFTLVASTTASSISFRIEDEMGMAVTSFQPDQTKLMHLYIVRSDLTGYQHVHPTMAADGTWSAKLATMQPGTYRAYASFVTADSSGSTVDLVLSSRFTVPGTPSAATPLPAAATSTSVDGYTVTVSGELMSGMEHALTATISKNGMPVTDLQPYLDTYAHLTAFHEGDMAFAHLHPQGTVNGDHGGPTLTFDAAMAASGNYRLFLQFQTGGVLHTAAITMHVG